MSGFGWSYPAGAANDPNAPYNQPDYSDEELREMLIEEEEPYANDPHPYVLDPDTIKAKARRLRE